jgi:GTP-binding protein
MFCLQGVSEVAVRTVAIVGRPNVGKSTLFNRIIGARRSVVHETPGVTRDQIVELTQWAEHAFLLMDTGGIIPFGETVSEFDRLVTDVAEEAIAVSDSILFMVDGQTGPTSWDQAIAKILLKSGKPILLVVNKVEKESARIGVSEFYTLGLGEPHGISAIHGQGVAEVMDRIVADFPRQEITVPCDCQVAIVGRPNVGKSSLLNRLVGRDAALVSEIPGTTRDAIHTDLKWHGRTLRLIDTAGLRRKSRIKEAVEAFSTMRTLRVVAECDVAVLMIDAAAGTVAQDAKIAGQIHDAGKGVVVAFNKWDLVTKDHATYREVWESFLQDVPFLTYAPWFTFSALSKQRLGRVLEIVWQVYEARQQRIETSELNRFLEEIVKRQPPRSHAGGHGKIYYGTQVESAPPTFVLSVNQPRFFARNYLRYLNNKIRQKYGFKGNRIFIRMKKH